MTNPFADAARDLAGRLQQIAAEDRAAAEAADAERLATERSFERATALFTMIQGHVNACVRQANEALEGTGASLSTKVEPIKPAQAGSIAVVLDGVGKTKAYFRIVGNASFKTFVHELKEPKYGPFDLGDADALPYEEMFNQFLRSATQSLAADTTGKLPA